MGVWVFFIFVRICVFCVLLWWITLAVWWRETLTMTMERRDIYCHPFWSRDKGKKNHDILTTRQYFGRKIEIFGLHWHDMSAPFKRFKWACLYRSQKMLWSSIRGCSMFIAGSLDIWIGPKIGEIRRRPLKHSDRGSLRRTQPAIRLWCSLSQKVK